MWAIKVEEASPVDSKVAPLLSDAILTSYLDIWNTVSYPGPWPSELIAGGSASPGDVKSVYFHPTCVVPASDDQGPLGVLFSMIEEVPRTSKQQRVHACRLLASLTSSSSNKVSQAIAERLKLMCLSAIRYTQYVGLHRKYWFEYLELRLAMYQHSDARIVLREPTGAYGRVYLKRYSLTENQAFFLFADFPDQKVTTWFLMGIYEIFISRTVVFMHLFPEDIHGM